MSLFGCAVLMLSFLLVVHSLSLSPGCSLLSCLLFALLDWVLFLLFPPFQFLFLPRESSKGRKRRASRKEMRKQNQQLSLSQWSVAFPTIAATVVRVAGRSQSLIAEGKQASTASWLAFPLHSVRGIMMIQSVFLLSSILSPCLFSLFLVFSFSLPFCVLCCFRLPSLPFVLHLFHIIPQLICLFFFSSVSFSFHHHHHHHHLLLLLLLLLLRGPFLLLLLVLVLVLVLFLLLLLLLLLPPTPHKRWWTCCPCIHEGRRTRSGVNNHAEGQAGHRVNQRPGRVGRSPGGHVIACLSAALLRSV